MTEDVLRWLQAWYARHCDGDWEHSWGVRIETLDNPGWHVKIDLAGTSLEGRSFTDVVEMRSEWDWVECRVEDDAFRGYGGAGTLTEILEIFRSWAESGPK